MQALLCDRLNSFIEKYYINSQTKFSVAVKMKYQQVQLYTTRKETRRTPSLDVIARMEKAGINKVWLAFGVGPIYTKSEVGKIIQMLEYMQENKDLEMLRNAIMQSISLLSQYISTLKTDPSRNLQYKPEDIPMLEDELVSMKILADLHLREKLDDVFNVPEGSIVYDAIEDNQKEKNTENKISEEVEAMIKKTAKATAEEFFRLLKKG